MFRIFANEIKPGMTVKLNGAWNAVSAVKVDEPRGMQTLVTYNGEIETPWDQCKLKVR